MECSGDGSFVLTKPENTGGLVSQATVAEQLVYEIGDPKSYILPDVICDFSDVQLKEISSGKVGGVLVTGAAGRPPTDQFKVLISALGGRSCDIRFLSRLVPPILMGIGPRRFAQ